MVKSGAAQQALADQMDDIATKCVQKSRHMTKALQRGVDSLPHPVQKELAKEDTNRKDDYDVAGMKTEISRVDQDIVELDSCTRSLQKANLFTAASSGKAAFEGLESKQNLCGSLFTKIKLLSTSIMRMAQAFMGDSCCSQLWAFASEARNLFQCLRLSKLVTLAAKAARRLVTAIAQLFKTAWLKFKALLDEFEAAKKIKNIGSGRFNVKGRLGNFVNDLNPFGSKSGIVTTGIVKGLMPRKSPKVKALRIERMN